MSETVPRLDSRSRDQVVLDAVTTVAGQVQGAWKGGIADEPGTALINAYADMVQAAQNRLNRAPEKHRLAVARRLGPQPRTASPSRTDVEFTLSAPAEEPITIPAGTEVSTAPEGDTEPVVFTTIAPCVIRPCQLLATRFTTQNLAPNESGVFTDPGRDEDPTALIFILSRPVPSTSLTFKISDPKLVAANEHNLTWQAWQGTWVDCGIVADTTNGLRKAGTVTLTVEAHAPAVVDFPNDPAPRLAYHDVGLIRCVTSFAHPHTFERIELEPQLRVTVGVIQGEIVGDQDLGRASGEPGQTFTLPYPPLAPLEHLRAELVIGQTRQLWQCVESLQQSTESDRHFTVDPCTGEVIFAPLVHHPTGTRRHGALPETGAQIRLLSYRTGGGACGNVMARTITRLRSPVPFVSTVTNPRPALGGIDAELPSSFTRRMPLRPLPKRAVTASDYEQLALASPAGIAQASCRLFDPATADIPAKDTDLWIPATTSVEFGHLPPGLAEIPKGTQVSTASGIRFTTEADTARLGNQPTHTTSQTLNAADRAPSLDQIAQPQNSAPPAISSRVNTVGFYVGVPLGTPLEGLTLQLRRTQGAGPISVSVFLPIGKYWWDLDTYLYYEVFDKEKDISLKLYERPQWKHAVAAGKIPTTLEHKGWRFFPELMAGWVALHINEHSAGTAKSEYSIYYDPQKTGPVAAGQYYDVPKETPIPKPKGWDVSAPLRLRDWPIANRTTVSVPSIEVKHGSEDWKPWTTVESFEHQSADSECVVINSSTGEVYFGSAVSDSSAQIIHGKPPAQTDTFRTGSLYQATRGGAGNVGPGEITVHPVPGQQAVASGVTVTNPGAAAGGKDGYTVVTGGGNGLGVRLVVVPAVAADGTGRLPFPQLALSDTARATLLDSLAPYQPPGVGVRIITPTYRGIGITAAVSAVGSLSAAEAVALCRQAETTLYRYFNPLTGGPDATGWPLGRAIDISDAYNVLYAIPDIASVATITMQQMDPITEKVLDKSGSPPRIDCKDNETVYSVRHVVTLTNS
ncbi:baseplate J/gp47 family protein [Nocardia brasiliensis]|uniref:baseplate J/gp47 family protein n=1 Tax=Nocardia brasiliensis TaxID=37326 RepID=UPI002456E664|nr:baseplate J/gp47 family protein [Nocardia brasiliensis]